MPIPHNLNEMSPDGHREDDFRRDVRQALDMHPLDRDDKIVEEIKRLKRVVDQLEANTRFQHEVATQKKLGTTW